MAGPLVFWPNRKSAIGVRACSRVPRHHHLPGWSTTPPIAEVTVDEVKIAVRRVLSGMVLVLIDSSDDAQKKMIDTLDSVDDVRLVALAQEALQNFKRQKSYYDRIDGEYKTLRGDVDRLRNEMKNEEGALKEAAKAIAERDEIASKYRELKKQIDPEKQQLEIMYAIDEATAAIKEESTTLRKELGQRQTEIEALRVSKKRLREALDRLAGKD